MVIQCPEPVVQTGLEPSDQSLLRRFKTGDQQAATRLYQRYSHRLRALVKARCSPALARNLEPDDVVQSAFGAFFQKAGAGFYAVPAGDDLWSLLMVITLNKLRSKIAFHTAAKRNGATTFSGEDFDKFLGTKEADEAAGQALQMVVREIMDDLPPSQMAMMELRLQGFEVAEIAAKTERSKRTVERVMQEFRQRLDAILKEDR